MSVFKVDGLTGVLGPVRRIRFVDTRLVVGPVKRARLEVEAVQLLRPYHVAVLSRSPFRTDREAS